MKKSKIKTTEVVDSKTGEILEKKYEKVSYEGTENFVKMYFDDISRLFQLTASQYKVLFALLPRMTWESEVVFTSSIRTEIQKSIGLSASTFKNTLQMLQQLGLLLRIENNRYLLNPHIFAKGTPVDVKRIQMQVTYDKNGRMIKTTYDRQLDIDFPSEQELK